MFAVYLVWRGTIAFNEKCFSVTIFFHFLSNCHFLLILLLARQITGSIAFSSYVKTDITGLNKGEVIKFDGLLVNDGNAYDVTTGIFTAPRDGLYLFSYFVEDYTDQDLWVYLRQDNYVRSQAVAEPYAEHQNIMGGNVVLLHCAAGSRIWIVIDIGTRVQGNLSTFSGIFLH